MKRVELTLKQKKVIFWDWNGTLVQDNATFRHHFIQVVGEFMGRWDTIVGKEHELLKAYESLRRSSRGKRRQAKSLKEVLKSYSFEPDDAFIDAFFTRLNERRQAEPIFEKHAKQSLQALSEKYRMGVISNRMRRELKQGHEQLNKWLPVENWFTAHSTGSRKPDTKIFKIALKKMNVSPGRAVMIGNHWRNDIQAALKCGMDAIWLQKKQKRRVAYKKIGKRHVIIVRSLQDIPRLFSL